jgi:hypothetical protein
MPLELVMLDNSRVNYSSMRGGMLQYYRHAKGEQRHFCDHFLKPVWDWKIAEFIARGLLPNHPDAFRADFVPEGWTWLDPITEAQGQQLALDMGITTLDEVTKSMGKDFATLLQQRKREIEDMRAAGLPEVRSTFTRDPQPVDAQSDNEGEVTKEEMQAEFRVLRAELRADAAETLASRPAPAPPPAQPNFTINVPEPQVTIERLAVDVPEQPAPIVHVHAAEQPAPVVNMSAPESPQIVVEVPQQAPPVVNVQNDVHVETPKRTLKITRDVGGRVTGGEVE